MKIIPPSLLVLSILGLLWGLFVLARNTFLLALLMGFTFGLKLPINPLLRHDPIYITISSFFMFTQLILVILIIAGSIGSLKLLPWARRVMFTWAWIYIAINILETAFTLVYVFPKTCYLDSGKYMPPDTSEIVETYSINLAASIAALIFPLCILYFFTRPRVRNAFQGIFPPPPSNFPVILPQHPPT